MNILVAVAILLLATGAAAEQESVGNPPEPPTQPAARPTRPPARPRMTAGELLGGRPAPTSFNELQSILERGHEVVVTDGKGHRTRGWISSLSADRIVIFREGPTPFFRLFSPPEERAFAADTVTRIDIVDSTWQGGLIGLAVTPALIYGAHRWEEHSVPDTNNMKGLATILAAGASIALCGALGRAIDLRINEPVFERYRQPRRVTLDPMLGRQHIGVMARVHF